MSNKRGKNVLCVCVRYLNGFCVRTSASVLIFPFFGSLSRSCHSLNANWCHRDNLLNRRAITEGLGVNKSIKTYMSLGSQWWICIVGNVDTRTTEQCVKVKGFVQGWCMTPGRTHYIFGRIWMNGQFKNCFTFL